MFGVAGLEEVGHKTEVWENQTLQLTRILAPPTAGTAPPLLAPARLDPAHLCQQQLCHLQRTTFSSPSQTFLSPLGSPSPSKARGVFALLQLWWLVDSYSVYCCCSCLRTINCLCSKVAYPDDFTTWLQ